ARWPVDLSWHLPALQWLNMRMACWLEANRSALRAPRCRTRAIAKGTHERFASRRRSALAYPSMIRARVLHGSRGENASCAAHPREPCRSLALATELGRRPIDVSWL